MINNFSNLQNDLTKSKSKQSKQQKPKPKIQVTLSTTKLSNNNNKLSTQLSYYIFNDNYYITKMMFNANNKKFFYILALVASATANASASSDECTPGSNEVFCASASECINPTETACEFSGAAYFDATLGDVDLLCRDGQTNLPSTTLKMNECTLTKGTGSAIGGVYVNNLNGYYTLSGNGCLEVPFTGCAAQTNVDTSGGHCKTVSTGQVYCPESESCIDPSTTHCLFGGEIINGPGAVELQCAKGRVNLENGEIETGINFQNTMGGKYISDLNGKIKFKAGAKGIVTGCVITHSGIVGLRTLRGSN